MVVLETFIVLKTLFLLIIAHFVYNLIKTRRARRKEMAQFQYNLKGKDGKPKDQFD